MNAPTPTPENANNLKLPARAILPIVRASRKRGAHFARNTIERPPPPLIKHPAISCCIIHTHKHAKKRRESSQNNSKTTEVTKRASTGPLTTWIGALCKRLPLRGTAPHAPSGPSRRLAAPSVCTPFRRPYWLRRLVTTIRPETSRPETSRPLVAERNGGYKRVESNRSMLTSNRHPILSDRKSVV